MLIPAKRSQSQTEIWFGFAQLGGQQPQTVQTAGQADPEHLRKMSVEPAHRV